MFGYLWSKEEHKKFWISALKEYIRAAPRPRDLTKVLQRREEFLNRKLAIFWKRFVDDWEPEFIPLLEDVCVHIHVFRCSDIVCSVRMYAGTLTVLKVIQASEHGRANTLDDLQNTGQ